MQETTAQVATRQSDPASIDGIHANSAHSVPMSMAKAGERGVIVRISGNPEVKKFLSDLGFTVGTAVTAVSDLKGSKILSVRSSKIAIDCRMASKIMFCPE